MAAVLLYACSAFVIWSVLWPCYVFAQSYEDCPTSCDCLWILTDCSKKGLVSVPTDLARRSWGTKLELQSNGITTLGTDDFKGLYKLEELYLSHNDITYINGSVFEDLVSLKLLKITHNKLTEVPVFPRNNSIMELSLAHNMIHTVSSEALASLPHLRVLHLDHNQIMDLPIRAFPTPSLLSKLFLNNNKIMRLEPGCLDNLATLELLKLNKNQMFELKKEIFTNLTNLRLLELSKNKIGHIQGLTFSGLRSLQVLKLKQNSITTLMDGAFWGLESISNLQLDYNNISNVTSSWLFGLSALRQLSLTHNRISAVQQDGWDCCKKNLVKLDLTYNKLETIYSNTFRKLQHLEALLLDHNQLSRIDDGAFQDLGDLVTLEMNGNAIYWTMEDMSGAFSGLSKLVKLGLKMNHIKSITKQAFTGLKRLRQLYLEDNEITTIQDNSFQPLHNLRELRLNSTNLLCDCHIAWLSGWLRSYGFQNTVVAVCSYPEHLRGKSIFDISEDQLKCSDQEIPRPMIITSPVSQNAYKDENLTLNCTAAITGEAEPTIKWKKDNRVLQASLMQTLASSDGDIKRYTSTLNLHKIQDDDAGHYQCVVTNEFGSAFSNRSKVNVYVFPVFIKKPVDITVKAGQPAKLQCSASGQPLPHLSWHKDGDDFPAARERRMYVLPKDDQFFIASTRNTDEGVYTCRAENDAGIITANATVTILETPDFIRPMEDEKNTQVGDTSVLECMASGSPRPKLQWLKDSQPLVETPRHFFTADNQLLIVVETTWEDAGTYTCEMSNTLGIMRGVTRLKVISNDGQSGPSSGSSGLDDESTTTGIIIIAVVCCVVGTSLVWVIIIYQTRKRHEMYSATPTDETTLPGEVPSTGYSSSDREGSFTQQSMGITAYHYQDYQLKESGYESSSGHYRATNCNNNGWTGLRPPAAIFPSDVEEDEQGHDVCHHHRATSVSSLAQSGEESDTVLSTHSAPSWQGGGGGGSSPRVGLSGSSLLSTFHPGPTNHDRCPSRSIALPTVCGEASGDSVVASKAAATTVTATTQTPCPNCQRCDDSDGDREGDGVYRLHQESGMGVGLVHRDILQCESCRENHLHRHCPDGGNHSDSNAYHRPPSLAVPPRASSFSSLSAAASRPLRPGQQGPGVGAHCCGSRSHSGGHVRQHRHNGVCVGECGSCDRAWSAVCPACSHDPCLHPLAECHPRTGEATVRTLPPTGARDSSCCYPQSGADRPAPAMQHPHAHSHSHPHPSGGREHKHHPLHPHKDMNV